jgi:hypothetical protein
MVLKAASESLPGFGLLRRVWASFPLLPTRVLNVQRRRGVAALRPDPPRTVSGLAKGILNPLLSIAVLGGVPALAADDIQIRYRQPSERMSLTVTQEILVQGDRPLAGRDLSFDLSMAAVPGVAAFQITVDRATASYTAHEMKQRLGTRHLAGRDLSLAIVDDGRRLQPAEVNDPPVVPLDSMVESGFPVGAALADTLPVLPEAAVSVGATWTTERPVRSLEGWAWATGRLSSRHRITAIDREPNSTVITVETEATASLGPVEGGRAYSGELKRSLRWTFDAVDGRLLSLSMEQETDGVGDLPQGEIPLRQRTRVELAPAS